MTSLSTALDTRVQPRQASISQAGLSNRQHLPDFARAIQSVQPVIPVAKTSKAAAPDSAPATGFKSIVKHLFSPIDYASFYAQEIDEIFEDPRMVIKPGRFALDVCGYAVNAASAHEYEDLQQEWKSLLEDKVSTWNLYAGIEAAFAVFIYVSIQITDNTDSVSYCVAYLALISVGVGVAVSRLLVSWLNNDQCKTYHYALHIKTRRIGNQSRLYPSHEVLFSIAFWTLLWCTLCAAAAFLYSFLQATNGVVRVAHSAAFAIAARAMMGCILLAGASCLWLIQREFRACQADTRIPFPPYTRI
ncbi:hypothetical protein MIND_00780600 [Mycena indigotica]|uniref:Transmembrane protein n=1 Tax=Mycena indigotica TaxID=2126181 RepID=A0A8H6SN86_9AGAR|nr:uncharacterized protein MIND_00780600 [Mycena indigotica]KAF7302138.1 hypothetical protein MIND_00780600 [Mycena indigotica]